MLDKPVPSQPIEWIAIDKRNPTRSTIVCTRFYFDARNEAARRLRADTGHVLVQAVGDGVSVERVLDYLRQRVAAERQLVGGPQVPGAGAKAGRSAS